MLRESLRLAPSAMSLFELAPGARMIAGVVGRAPEHRNHKAIVPVTPVAASEALPRRVAVAEP
jgi:hypothetical protein